jgi:hypothetical protein
MPSNSAPLTLRTPQDREVVPTRVKLPQALLIVIIPAGLIALDGKPAHLK